MATRNLRAGRFVESENDPRTKKPAQGDEKEALIAFLRWQRETLELNNFDGAVGDPTVVEEAWRAWRAEVSFADQYVAEASDLDVLGGRPDRDQRSLRWVLLHMIEEYARHLGHADLLRERIDGRVGM